MSTLIQKLPTEVGCLRRKTNVVENSIRCNIENIERELFIIWFGIIYENLERLLFKTNNVEQFGIDKIS